MQDGIWVRGAFRFHADDAARFYHRLLELYTQNINELMGDSARLQPASAACGDAMADLCVAEPSVTRPATGVKERHKAASRPEVMRMFEEALRQEARYPWVSACAARVGGAVDSVLDDSVLDFNCDPVRAWFICDCTHFVFNVDNVLLLDMNPLYDAIVACVLGFDMQARNGGSVTYQDSMGVSRAARFGFGKRDGVASDGRDGRDGWHA